MGQNFKLQNVKNRAFHQHLFGKEIGKFCKI